MDWEDRTVTELKNGYWFDGQKGVYTCSLCNEQFAVGEIFQINGRFFDAKTAVVQHMRAHHPDYVLTLANSDSKYNTLTDNQKKLLRLFAMGLSDKEIAKELSISISTVRHQKFSFREKAKQAKFYLAVFEGILQDPPDKKRDLMPIHRGAKMVDERYMTTNEEREQILHTFFSRLSPPLRLREFPPKEKNKVVILGHIAQEFAVGTDYTEQQVNEILGNIYSDFATLRRYLITYGFMKRSKDGNRYWRT